MIVPSGFQAKVYVKESVIPNAIWPVWASRILISWAKAPYRRYLMTIWVPKDLQYTGVEFTELGKFIQIDTITELQ